MSDELIEQAKRFYHKFGPANCWTGTSGEASRVIKGLVERIEKLEGKLNANENRKCDCCRVRCIAANLHGEPQFGVVFTVSEEVSSGGEGTGEGG